MGWNLVFISFVLKLLHLSLILVLNKLYCILFLRCREMDSPGKLRHLLWGLQLILYRCRWLDREKRESGRKEKQIVKPQLVAKVTLRQRAWLRLCAIGWGSAVLRCDRPDGVEGGGSRNKPVCLVHGQPDWVMEIPWPDICESRSDSKGCSCCPLTIRQTNWRLVLGLERWSYKLIW